MTRFILVSLLLVAAFSAHLAAAAPQKLDDKPQEQPLPATNDTSLPGRGSHCWRIRVNCALEPDHKCCGVGSNQPPPKRESRQAEKSPAIIPGQNTKPLPRPDAAQASGVQTLPAEVPDRGQPSTGPQVQPKPSPAESGVQTLPAEIPDREQPSTGPQVEPKPEGVQTLPAEIPPKETKPFPRPGQPRPQVQPKPQVEPKPQSGVQTLPAEIPEGVQTLPGEVPEEGKPGSGPQVQPKPESGVQTLPAELPPKETKPLPRPQRPVQPLPAKPPQE